MKKVMTLAIVFLFGMTTPLFAQVTGDKIPTPEEVKVQLKRDVEAAKRDVKKTKDAVEKDVRSDVAETKRNVEKVKQEVKGEINKAKGLSKKSASKKKEAAADAGTKEAVPATGQK